MYFAHLKIIILATLVNEHFIKCKNIDIIYYKTKHGYYSAKGESLPQGTAAAKFFILV